MGNQFLGRRQTSLIICVLCFFLTQYATAQTSTFKAEPYSDLRQTENLDFQFSSYKLFTLNIGAVKQHLTAGQDVRSLQLDLPSISKFNMQLEVNPLKGPGYLLRVAGENGIIRKHDTEQVTYKGHLNDGSIVRLTVDDGFFYGMIENASSTLYFEPLWFYAEDAPENAIVAYWKKNIIEREYGICQVKMMQNVIEQEIEKSIGDDGARSAVACKEVEIALADDWLMFDKYNSVSAVENHNLAVINNVQTNYDNEFNDELMFVVVEIWVSTCSTCDPWTNSTDPGDLLDDFTIWAPNGFDETHDVASLWTDRNFDGPTIGLAWLNTVCGFGRYNVLEDFSGNANLLRVLQAHELGHNFSATHDEEGSETIMAPSVSNTNTWSAQSMTQINNKVNNANCLGPCSSGAAPVANFTADMTSGCAPLTVQFTDQSTNEPTEWQWTFTGGNPSSSTEQNPSVTYDEAGVYDVILEASNNNGSNTKTEQEYIEVLDIPIADFVAENNGLQVSFTNLSQGSGVLTYFWDFDDGFTSSEFEPVHIFDDGGTYTVILTATNECGENSYTQMLELVSPPVAAFSADVYLGCEPLTVQFLDESTPQGNFNTYTWVFEGGNPATSSQQNPIVVYENPGIFDVEMIVDNESGIDVLTMQDLIEVFPNPEADFGYAVNALEVSFLNNSMNADSYFWDFGDGNTSTSESPSHTYDQGGVFTVMLVSENNCGGDTIVKEIVLDSAPLALYSLSENSGCAPLTVTFANNSLGEIEFIQWSFPGGSPSSSNQQVVNVTYSAPGVYDVTLIVGNTIGIDTLFEQAVIEIFEDPVSDFSYGIDENVVNFFNESENGNVLLWDLGDGQTSTDVNPVHAYDDDGTYEVWLIIEGECGLDTSVAEITIATPPTAGFSYNMTNGCEPLEVQFFNTSSSNATSFLWEFPGGQPESTSEEDPMVTYEFAGTYSVSLTVWSEGGSDVVIMEDLITVDPRPMATFNTNINNLNVDFNNLSIDANEFHWLFGDGLGSNEENPSHTYATFGNYTITLVATNACGQDTFTIDIEVSTSPIPLFTASETQGCVPFTVEFTDESQNGVENWSWTFPGGNPDTSNLQNPVVVYGQPGVYSVILRVSNATGTVVLVKEEYIIAGEPPLASFDFLTDTNYVEFENQSELAESYHWDFGDGTTSDNKNPDHNYAEDGEYLVTLVVSNYCGSDTAEQVVFIKTTSIDVLDEHPVAFEVFPNPNTGNFSVVMSGSITHNPWVYIHDVLGRVIFREKGHLTNGRVKWDVDITDKQAGIYVIHVLGPDYQVSRNIVKQ